MEQLESILGNAFFTPHALTEQINILKPPSQVLLQTIFPAAVPEFSNVIKVEISDQTRSVGRVAPMNFAGAIPADLTGTTTKAVALPRIAEQVVITSAQIRAWYSSLQQSATSSNYMAENLSKYIAQAQLELRDKVARRHEIMAAQAVTGGKITSLAGDKESFEIDFGFVDTVNSITLTAGARWSESTAAISADIAKYSRQIFQRTGVQVQNAVVGRSVVDALLGNAKVLTILEKNSNVNAGSLNINQPATNWRYLGEVAGVKLWEYADIYGASTDIFPANKVVFFAASPQFAKVHYAPPTNLNAGFTPQLYHSQIIRDTDGWGIKVYAESVAAPIIWYKDAFISVQVID
jgi:hypothetical protein